MADETVVTFTCDRCHLDLPIIQEGSTIRQPKDWGRLTLTMPPRANPNDKAKVVGDLCTSCVASFHQFMGIEASETSEKAPV